jgi:hypothetical protein
MPEPLARLALRNKRVVYDLLFRAAAATLLQVAADPTRLGAAIGGLMVLHTWGQRLQHHPHVHCVVPAGGLSPDGARWIHARPTFFLPVKVLRQVFRGKLVAGLRDAFRQGRLTFPGALQTLAREPAFRAWLRSLHEFIRRFLVHVLPKRFVRIRYFGLLAPRCRTHALATCRAALAVVPAPPATEPSVPRSAQVHVAVSSLRRAHAPRRTADGAATPARRVPRRHRL